MKTFLGLVSVVVLLAGCSSATPPEPAPEPEVVEEAEVKPEDTSPEVPDLQTNSWSVSASDFDQSIRAAFSAEYVEFDEVTRYAWGQLDFVESVSFAASMSIDDNQQLLNVVLAPAYFDEEWLFFRTMEVRAGDTTYEFGTFRKGVNKIESVESGGWVSEVGGVEIGKDQELILEALLGDPNAKFRLTGSSGGTKERAFTAEERDLIRYFYNAYQGVKQGMSPR